MKTILVTGGAGFIGSNFVRYLYNKYPDYRIIVLDVLTYAGNVENSPEGAFGSSRYEFWHGDVRNSDLVDTLVSQSDSVVHMAAETHVTRSIYDNRLFFDTDVLGSQTVANAVVKHRDRIERFIHVSTSEVYGTAMSDRMDENHPLNPLSPYSAAKCGADRLVYAYRATYGIPVVIVRPFNNYGPFQHLEKAIPRFVTSCLLNEPLRVHGDGGAQRDWLHVQDTCEALDRLLHCDLGQVSGEVFNLGTGVSMDIKTVARKLVELTGRPESLVHYVDDRPGQVFRHTADVSKAKRVLGWEPRIRMEDGLDMTIDWYRKNRAW